MRPEPEALGGGLWSVPVPIPGNPLGYTLVYALESERGPVLIDAGWQHEEAWTALHDGLAALGLDVTDVYGVVVTHHHPDHAGLAGRVREASGAWIAMHEADAKIVRSFREMAATEGGRSQWDLAALRTAGASEADLTEYSEAGAHRGRKIDPPAQPDREVADGELIDLPGRKLRVIWTPGHSPGHICLHLEDAGRLFTGDHVLPRITPHIGLYPYDWPDVDPLGDYLDSLSRVADLGAAAGGSGSAIDALPAHEHRFSGIAGRVTEIARHHEERLAEVAGLLTSEPATLWDIATRMTWNSSWRGMHPMMRRMATGEAAAHLRTLERRGLVHAHPGTPLTYSR
ncbi:MAG TPA: MBL fold metallo-hydrolase [Streptosporangiaceae bacterium]|jgi:glyoxylase-like metal-dependent hydrolase (beta-lactamase superfamily II)